METFSEALILHAKCNGLKPLAAKKWVLFKMYHFYTYINPWYLFISNEITPTYGIDRFGLSIELMAIAWYLYKTFYDIIWRIYVAIN